MASTAGITARLEPSPPDAVAVERVEAEGVAADAGEAEARRELSPPPFLETVTLENASAAPPAPVSGLEPILPVGLPSASLGVTPWPRPMNGRAVEYAA